MSTYVNFPEMFMHFQKVFALTHEVVWIDLKAVLFIPDIIPWSSWLLLLP